jgi:hypothetical protein
LCLAAAAHHARATPHVQHAPLCPRTPLPLPAARAPYIPYMQASDGRPVSPIHVRIICTYVRVLYILEGLLSLYDTLYRYVYRVYLTGREGVQRSDMPAQPVLQTPYTYRYTVCIWRQQRGRHSQDIARSPAAADGRAIWCSRVTCSHPPCNSGVNSRY